MAEEIERIYIIPLKKVGFKSSKAAPTAIKRVKSYLTRHMKVEEKDIWIDESLNNAIWTHGKFKMANKIRVKAVKFDDGVVEAYLPELEFKKSRRELLKEEKAKKEPILKKEEVPEEEAEPGAKDYDIAPTADGDVKIKKKKAPKKKEEKPAKKKKTKKESIKEEPKEEKKPIEKKSTKKPAAKKTAAKKTSTKTKKGEKAGKK